ncbi:MAG: acetolactate synthase small subunit [Bacteroidia bacterium]|nr:acetolactate synthase small subunit [Bacteroidia bacterium]
MQSYVLSIFTEDQIGLLHRITTIFTRRNINIESLTTSETEISGIFRFIIVIRAVEADVEKLRKQIEKIIGVIKAFLLRKEDIVQQELALYKIAPDKLVNGTLEHLIRENHIRVLAYEQDYVMIEKTGHPGETIELFRKLEPYGVLGFSRSGVIAISKKPLNVRSYLDPADLAELESRTRSKAE